MAKAYWIARLDVNDPEGKYSDYISTARPAMERHGARFIARGGNAKALEGEMRARNVIIEFPSMEEALAAYNSPEYQEATKIRQSLAEGELMIVEGVE